MNRFFIACHMLLLTAAPSLACAGANAQFSQVSDADTSLHLPPHRASTDQGGNAPIGRVTSSLARNDSSSAVSHGAVRDSIYPTITYNALSQKSSHNSYARDEALMDQLVYHQIRSIEFDVHRSKSGWSGVAGNWYVYHSDGESETTCHRLSDCLDELLAFHLANPDHEVVTVWVDLKDDFVAGWAPSDLDARLAQHISRSLIFTPADLQAACPGAPTLQRAVTAGCVWPDHLHLRGKFIFAVTGGDLVSPTSRLSTYAVDNHVARIRMAFVAPDLKSASTIGSRGHAIFFNIDSSRAELAFDVYSSGFVSRVWDLNDAIRWFRAAQTPANHLATNSVNYHEDPWATTQNRLGWPFSCLDGSACDNLSEPGNSISAEVVSGDIWGSSDSFLFAYEATPSPVSRVWTTSVATVNSHVDEWGKGCLMARAGTTSSDRYFAVCRAADDHKLRVQYRGSRGGPTSASEVNIVAADTIDQESLTFVRLALTYDGTQTCASGYGSQNGIRWKLIDSMCFAGSLPYQGVAASSHGSGAMRIIFTGLAKDGIGYNAAKLPMRLAIGNAASGWISDGVGF